MKSNIEIADELIDMDIIFNTENSPPLVKYKGTIDGKEYNMSSALWTYYKIKTEGRHADTNLISTRVGRGWSEEEATSAYIGESLQTYRRRISDKKEAKRHLVGKYMDSFIYAPVVTQ